MISASSSGSACVSRAGVWAGYVGPGDPNTLRRLLGDDAQIYGDENAALGALHGTGEAAALTVHPDGQARVSLGDVNEAGCSARLDPGEPAAITLACDPFGARSVYVARIGATWWFASNPRVLRRYTEVNTAVDVAARHGYLCFSHVPVPRTLWTGIRVLPAGATCTLRAADDITDAAFAAPPDLWRERAEGFADALDENTLVTDLRVRLQDAVCRRLGDADEAAVFLSGGLDSSIVAVLLARAGAHVHLFTLDFEPPWDAELPCARQVAAHLKRPLHVVSARAKDIGRALDATAAALHQPLGDGVTVPLFLLGRAASNHAAIVFNGEGGDQLFGGWTNKPLLAAELYGSENYDRERAYLATYHRFHGQTDRLYTPRAREETNGVDVGAWIRPALNADGFSTLLHRLRAANLRLKGAQNIAPRAAQLADACGLRLRMPFFDRALADWSFTLPPDVFLRGACEKYLLKRAAEPLLPPEIVWREKRGMGVPTTDWCLGPLRKEVARRLSPNRLRRDGWLDPAFVKELLRGEDLPGEFRRRRVGEKLWALLMFHVWQDAQKDAP